MNRPDLKKAKKQSLLDKYAWIGFPSIVLFWVGYGFFQGELKTDPSFDRLNTLFSGLAFWGVIWAILLQKNELVLQREELELTRNEVRGQKEQLEAQNLTMKQQRFESTFFSLLDCLNGIVNSIEITGAQIHEVEPAKGHTCFTMLISEFRQVHTDISANERRSNKSSLEICQLAYDDFGRSRQALVEPYFRILYNIITFIDTNDIKHKQMYVNILKTQLSSSELSLLFYYCLSAYGIEKFKPLVQKYGLLENMEFYLTDERGLFDDSAFSSPSNTTKDCG